LIAVDYALINFSDLLVARGLYALRPDLPSVIGNEGAGRVLEVGKGVSNMRAGDRVVLPMGAFTWQERLVTRAENLVVVPQAVDSRVCQAEGGQYHPRSSPMVARAFHRWW
jgi:NADPH:quinone reductase-like Zn-dependent oxidoreductase